MADDQKEYPEVITSYRYALRGALGEFLDRTPFKELVGASDMVDVAACVAYHVEEGVRLYPEVIFCTDILTLSRQAPNSIFIEIGRGRSKPEGIGKALKKLPPLASKDWVILIEVSADGIRYGIFNPSPSPVSPDFGASLQLNGDDATPHVRISRAREDVVRFYSPSAGEFLLSFSHKEITKADVQSYATMLATQVLAGLPDESPTKAPTLTYLRRLLDYGLQQCHGTLICVVRDEGVIPPLLSNGILLSPPIDFGALAAQFVQGGESGDIKGRPFMYFDLVAGIISFDGVAVFSPKGRLLAYNCILDLSQNQAPQKHLGGSRRTAYAMLKSKVGNELACAYYQSQDGPAEITTHE